MKTPLTYGAIMAIAGAALTLALYFAGFHESAEKLGTSQWIGTLGGLTIGIACLSLAMREKRENFPATANWGYGSALGGGVLTGLIASAFSLVFAYVYFAIINPSMSEVILQSQIAAMEAKGVSASQIAQAEPMIRKWMSPGVMTFFQGFFGFIWSLLLSLIIAIFFRQRVSSATAGAPPTL